jgi:phage terminase small subunit
MEAKKKTAEKPKQTGRRDKDGLLPKEREFCYQYLLCNFNATTAARTVGYKNPRQMAVHLKGRQCVVKFLKKLSKKHFDKLDITVESVSQELARLGFSDITNLVDIEADTITLKDQEEMGTATRTIQSIEINDSRQNIGSDEKPTYVGEIKTKLRMHDKKGALDSLGKWLKMFVDQSESTINVNIAEAEAADEAYKKRFEKKSATGNKSAN